MRSVFPTVIYQDRLSNEELVRDLEAAVWMLEDGDEAGRAWCDRHNYPGYTSYASLDDLPKRATAFSDLADNLSRHAACFAKELHWDLDGRALRLDALWVNVLGEGGVHSGHIHPGSVVSGTVYVAMPAGAGPIKFEDPRLSAMMAAPQVRDDSPDDRKRFIYLEPSAGDILLWESWLRHEVVAGSSEAPRISISFNFGLADD